MSRCVVYEWCSVGVGLRCAVRDHQPIDGVYDGGKGNMPHLAAMGCCCE